MPDQERLPTQTAPSTSTPTTSTPTTTTSTDPLSTYGNSFVQDQVKKSSGKLSWERALGESLGGKLYDALAPQLTDDKLLDHARSAVTSALSSLKGKLEGQVQANEQEAFALFMTELDRQLNGVAKQVVVQSGLSDGVRGFVDDNPYAVVLAALGGAVAYVLSNQDLPLFEKELKVSGPHSVFGGVDIGRTMDLALEQVRVGYRYTGKQVKGEVSADKYQDGWGAQGKLSYQPDATSGMSISGSHTDRSGVQTSKVDLDYFNPDLSANAWWKKQTGGDAPGQQIGASVQTQGTGIQKRASGQWNSDGSWNVGAGLTGKIDKNGSWFSEIYGGETAGGQKDVGVRAGLRITW